MPAKKQTKQKEYDSARSCSCKPIEKIVEVEVPEIFHIKTERFLKELQKECDLTKRELIEACLYESEIDSRRYGVFAIASRMNKYHLSIGSER